MTVGLLLRRMTLPRNRQTLASANGLPPDNWVYIQEPDVRIGRIQVFNNWSPSMVADPATIWLGLEYFCRDGDDLWSMADGRFVDFAAEELHRIGMIDRRDMLDGTVVRVPKAYPAYFGEYREFGKLRDYLDRFANLYPVGRNGMHRYNNQDHSMLAADAAVSSIVRAGAGKADIWLINTEEDYHEVAGDGAQRRRGAA
jgi:protoporphyrinogen oxidase